MYTVDFKNVSEIGLESSPVAPALAGLRANEARYFWNKHKIPFQVTKPQENKEALRWVNEILKEKDLVFPYEVLEVSSFETENIKFVYVFYKNGLAINVMYGLNKNEKRAVGFKLSDGMEIPEEFNGKFKFATQKSKLAGTIRGSYFVIKGTY